MRISDQDSAPRTLLFKLQSVPTMGQLYLRSGQQDKELKEGDTFSPEDLSTGRVIFKHLLDKPRSGEFSLRAADPQLFSDPEKVHVQAVSMKPPQILTLSPLMVESPGATSVLSKSVLQVEDPDNMADVLLMVVEPPQHGHLTRLHGDRALNRFKVDELTKGQVQYVHDGTGATHDKTVLQINDGRNYKNVLLTIQVQHKAADGPLVQSVPVAWVKEGGMVRLDKKYLQTEYKGLSSEEIIYTILTEDGPRYGEVVLVSMPADSPGDSWRPPVAEDSGFTSTSSFTQQDVNDGAVWYRHRGADTREDHFKFKVSTEIAPNVQSDARDRKSVV